MIEPYQAIGLVPTMRGIELMHERDVWRRPDKS